MRYRFSAVALVPVLLAVVAATSLDTSHAPNTSSRPDPAGLVVHEWGTFTSIAERDGQAMQWQPSTGPTDLPCFVNRLSIGAKGLLVGTVRMETPVLYFYSPTATRVNVDVRFPKGAISEWFPKAAVTPGRVEPSDLLRQNFKSTISWADVNVQPGGPESFPTEDAKNHYYAARATDAAPLSVGSEREKFLFYRGVGNFEPPIRPIVRADGTIEVTNPDHRALGDLVFFENRGGAITFRIVRASGDRFTFDASSPRGDLKTLYAALERILVSAGLYQKEAAAMVETWRDSWFEEGARLLYIVPRQSVDGILPLDIAPQPKDVARVFVGRVELFTARTLNDVKTALENRDRAAIKMHGRFFYPIFDRIVADLPPASVAAFKHHLDGISGVLPWTGSSCRR